MSLPQAPFSQPNFVAVMKALLQPLVDQQNVTNTIPNLYNLDVAVGSQLDTVGQWIGPTRFVTVPLTGVFFSFDIDGVGFDQGAWAPTFGGATTLTALPDEEYRLLLYATVAANHWDGTVPGGEAALNDFWTPLGYKEYIIDNQDMTISFLLVGPVPNAVTQALYREGLLDIRAAGVGVNAHYFAQGANGIPFTPLFGFDIESPFIAGFDQGAWASETFAVSPQVTGFVVASEGPDKVSGSFYLSYPLHGAMGEGHDTVHAFADKALLTGAILESHDGVVSASTGSQQATLSGAMTEAHDRVSASAQKTSSGSAAIVEHSDHAVASGAPSVSGAASIQEASDVEAASGTVT